MVHDPAADDLPDFIPDTLDGTIGDFRERVRRALDLGWPPEVFVRGLVMVASAGSVPDVPAAVRAALQQVTSLLADALKNELDARQLVSGEASELVQRLQGSASGGDRREPSQVADTLIDPQRGIEPIVTALRASFFTAVRSPGDNAQRVATNQISGLVSVIADEAVSRGIDPFSAYRLSVEMGEALQQTVANADIRQALFFVAPNNVVIGCFGFRDIGPVGRLIALEGLSPKMRLALMKAVSESNQKYTPAASDQAVPKGELLRDLANRLPAGCRVTDPVDCTQVPPDYYLGKPLPPGLAQSHLYGPGQELR